ncbi:MAG: hypothetical protein CEO40_70 [Parcubacteria group bacterium LiPW_72]|nr:MAG: hypothetical protein CEO40_70 [Parcubacteria group bacterium LiPW_72]
MAEGLNLKLNSVQSLTVRLIAGKENMTEEEIITIILNLYETIQGELDSSPERLTIALVKDSGEIAKEIILPNHIPILPGHTDIILIEKSSS